VPSRTWRATARARLWAERERRRIEMGTVFTVIVIAFVIGTLGVVALGLFEITPLARHTEHYRDPFTGKRRFDSPHLDG
jgi:hypothetical protein